MDVGWIGLGAMGGPMAGILAEAGHSVRAFDVDPARLAALPAVAPVASVADAAREVEALVVMVATPEQLDAVLGGEEGALAALAPGSVLLVMSTVGPAPVVRWAAEARTREVEVVDAPVSGGVVRAVEGELVVMVGGAEAAVERVRPVLEPLARTVAVVGTDPGDGQKLKLVNQLLCGVHIAAAAEALAFAEAMGLDPVACREVVRGGAAASFMLEDRGARMVAGAYDDVKSALDIFVKDMGLVTDAARESTFPAPLASAAEQLYVRGRRAGLGRRDDSIVLEVLRGRAAP